MAYQVSSEVEQMMVRRFQRLIRKRSLIDTGALYRSIDVTAEIDDLGNMTVQIYSEDYLKYLDERFTLTNDFIKARGFDTLMRDSYEGWVRYMIRKFPLLSGFEKVIGNASKTITVELMN